MPGPHGIGVRSVGSRVMESDFTTLPALSLITVPAGITTRRPGILGVVRTTRRFVGEETAMPCAIGVS